jgi:hypothetical protein
VIADSLRSNQDGVLITEVNIDRSFYDASEPFREQAMAGKLHSGEVRDDKRSIDRKTF